MKNVGEIHESYLIKIDNLKEANDVQINKLKEVNNAEINKLKEANDIEISKLKEVNNVDIKKLKEETIKKEIDIGSRMVNAIQDLTQEMEANMSERDKKQAEVLGSA